MRTADGFIIRKCLDGDSAAFGLLVDKYKGGVYALAYSKLGNFHDAEDVTQEVFIKAYENLRSLRRWDSFHAWLYSITSNLCKDWIKKQRRRPDRDSIEEQEQGVLEELSISHHRDESLWESLRDLLDSQPESQRQVLTLYYLGGMNSREIAEFLGTSPTAIRHRIHRARLKLKKEMLAMMTGTFERKRLRASFTLRIIESVKHLKIQPMPRPTGPSWGISLIAGILLTVLSSGIQLNLIKTTDAFMGSAVPTETAALRTGELPVEFLWMGDSESYEPRDVKEPEAENLEMTGGDEKPGLANYGLSETSSESKDDPEDVIVEPNSGLRFTRILSGPKLDVVGRSDYYMTVSRDGNFLFAPLGPGDRPPGWVIPLRQGQEPFKLAPELGQIHYLSWSWDMRNIAFIAYPRGELYVMPFSPETGKVTGPAKKIMEGMEDGKDGWTPPSWSPDGQQITFSRGKGFDIWTIPSTGGNPKNITNDPAAEHAPIWLADGKNILFCRNRDPGKWRLWDTFTIPAEGGTAEKIIENAYSRCGVSANGKWFAFPQREGESGGFCKFGIVRLSDKHQIDVAIPEEVGDLIGWSGNKLLFCRRALEEWCGLSVVHAYGGPSVELGGGVNLDAWTQSWSPDGKTIITGTFWIVPVDGGTPTYLELETDPKRRGIPWEPFSPNLKHYAFPDEEKSLWIAPVSIEERRVTGPAVKITEEVARTGDVLNVSWSSDSKKIAFSSSKDGSADIWTASVDGSDLKQLTNDPGDERDPVWSPDGNMLAYDRESSVWVAPAAGGEPREIDKKRSWTKPTWSPDGKEIAFIQDDQLCISIMELSTGKTRRIDNIPKESWSLAWSPDGGKLAFLSYVDGRHRVYVVPAVGGQPVELAIDDSGSKDDLYWSPDGRMLSFNSFKSVKARTGSIWEADVSELLDE